MQVPSDKDSGAKYGRDSPSLRGSSGTSPQMLWRTTESWAGEDGEGMNESLNEVESLDRLSKNRHSIKKAFFKRVLLD